MIFDASESTAQEHIISSLWDFGDDANGDGAVASHPYSQEGVCQVRLNVADSAGLSNSESLTVIIKSVSSFSPLILRAFLLVFPVVLGLMFGVLPIRREKRKTLECMNHGEAG